MRHKIASIFVLGGVCMFGLPVPTAARRPVQIPMSVSDFTVLGWTADSRYVAFEYKGTAGENYDSMIVAQFATVYDALNDTGTQYLLKWAQPEDGKFASGQPDDSPYGGPPSEYSAWIKMPGKGKYEAWRKANALSAPNQDLQCGDAKVTIELRDLVGDPDNQPNGAWKNKLYEFTTGLRGVALLGVEIKGVAYRHAELLDTFGTISVAWSPNCRFVAWFVPSGSYLPPYNFITDRFNFSAGGSTPYYVKPVGPAIDVMAHASQATLATPVLQAIDKAGFPVHLSAPAQQTRTKTQIYAWGTFTEIAKKIAAAIPGGASVEPLTWHTPADIVVAVGASATP
jgi:hypothetical protein